MLALIAILLAQSCDPADVCGYRYFAVGLSSSEPVTVWKGIEAGDGTQLKLLGARSDVEAAAVVLGNTLARDSGYAVEIRRGPEIADRIATWDSETGNLYLSCGRGANTESCTLVDQSGISGHISHDVMPEYYGRLQGRLGENRRNTLADGGCNAFLADGGCYAEFTALHGEWTITSSVPRHHGGWGLQYENPVGDGTGPHRFFVDTWGGVGQRHNMIRAQFPKCPADVSVTTPQAQIYFTGAVESTLLYAFDEHEWYFCDGTDWQPFRTGDSMLASAGGRSLAIVSLVALVLLALRRRHA